MTARPPAEPPSYLGTKIAAQVGWAGAQRQPSTPVKIKGCHPISSGYLEDGSEANSGSRICCLVRTAQQWQNLC